MKITEFQARAEGNRLEERTIRLRLLADQPSDRERRPCPACELSCDCPDRSPTCCCACSPSCVNAPAMLSSDPKQFPIEANILPLVYALSTLRVIETCWSCEGHEDAHAKVIKVPQVWFYSPCAVYPELIAQHANDLHVKKKLHARWQVVVSPFSACDATTFSLRPELEQGTTLSELRRDIPVLAKRMHKSIRALALAS